MMLIHMQVVPTGSGFLLVREAGTETVILSRAEAEAIAAQINKVKVTHPDLATQIRRFGADSMLPNWKPTPPAGPAAAG